MTSFTNNSHIFLIGSTGRTGRQLIERALARNYTVTALARNPDSISQFDGLTGLRIVKGSPTSASDLSNALSSAHDHANGKQIVIISTLGQTRASGNPWSATTSPPMFMTEAAKTLLSSLSTATGEVRSAVRKVIVISMSGVGGSFKNLHCLIKPVMNHSNMKQTLDDHNALDAVIKGQSAVNWVMVRPTMLKEGDAAEVKVYGDDGVDEGWLPSSITVGTVVEFMLDTIETSEWDRKTPVICN